MAQRRVLVRSASGLHARPAAVFTRAAAASGLRTTIAKIVGPGAAGPSGPGVDASSILMVLGLGVRHGDEVIIEAEGPDADSVLDGLAALLARDLDASGAA